MAGRSVESLFFAQHKLVHPKIGWWEIVIVLPVMIVGGIWPIGFLVDWSSHSEFENWQLLAVFGFMWFGLGAVTVVAFVVQWRLRRRLAAMTRMESQVEV
jgi:hypothetical protein